MKVLVFGSQNDPQAWEMTPQLRKRLPDTEFINTDNPQDLLEARGEVCIIDVVRGLENPQPISVDQLAERKLYTAHDFDLGYFLKLLKGSGMIDDFRIIGIPEKWDNSSVERVSSLLDL